MRSYVGRVLDVQRGATSNGHLPAGVATGAGDTLLLVMRPTEAAADAMVPLLLCCGARCLQEAAATPCRRATSGSRQK